jgi:hypothetical protein
MAVFVSHHTTLLFYSFLVAWLYEVKILKEDMGHKWLQNLLFNTGYNYIIHGSL